MSLYIKGREKKKRWMGRKLHKYSEWEKRDFLQIGTRVYFIAKWSNPYSFENGQI